MPAISASDQWFSSCVAHREALSLFAIICRRATGSHHAPDFRLQGANRFAERAASPVGDHRVDLSNIPDRHFLPGILFRKFHFVLEITLRLESTSWITPHTMLKTVTGSTKHSSEPIRHSDYDPTTERSPVSGCVEF